MGALPDDTSPLRAEGFRAAAMCLADECVAEYMRAYRLCQQREVTHLQRNLRLLGAQQVIRTAWARFAVVEQQVKDDAQATPADLVYVFEQRERIWRTFSVLMLLWKSNPYR